MATLEQVAEAHYRRQAKLAQRTAAEMARLWAHLDTGSIKASWRLLLPRALTVLSSAQTTAAASAGSYTDDALEAQGLRAGAEGRIAAEAFAGTASDGRRLDTLLSQPALRALARIGAGLPVQRARDAGLLELDMIVRTQVADAGRAADQAALVARPQVTGYVRMVVGRTCSRCLILAGRRYRWNAGFSRHPRCDCRHVPAAEDAAGDVRTTPRAAFAAMSTAEQDRVFGKAGAAAIRDGADPAAVVNARRGMVTAADGRRFTTEAAGRRPRLMPEQIYVEARGDRVEAIRLLKLHGYLR
ncbi:hypothetical protein [Actinoplanes sp. N902-109]|uniref:VG15 protein n=1 Tax=Actinoplanes sp. (strain N902-109) TaxID=649831 RepID=UPI000329629D|nr:hypothetical protein [Actinoplanes sp. N902-109]AGL13869.1 hypothetical protein L083_0359 [Actinoplanes sp. N902-109]